MFVRRGRDTGFYRSRQVVVVLDLEDAQFIIEDMGSDRDGFWRDLVGSLQREVDTILEEVDV